MKWLSPQLGAKTKQGSASVEHEHTTLLDSRGMLLPVRPKRAGASEGYLHGYMHQLKEAASCARDISAPKL
jgi:hypothetical protein